MLSSLPILIASVTAVPVVTVTDVVADAEIRVDGVLVANVVGGAGLTAGSVVLSAY